MSSQLSIAKEIERFKNEENQTNSSNQLQKLLLLGGGLLLLTLLTSEASEDLNINFTPTVSKEELQSIKKYMLLAGFLTEENFSNAILQPYSVINGKKLYFYFVPGKQTYLINVEPYEDTYDFVVLAGMRHWYSADGFLNPLRVMLYTPDQIYFTNQYTSEDNFLLKADSQAIDKADKKEIEKTLTEHLGVCENFDEILRLFKNDMYKFCLEHLPLAPGYMERIDNEVAEGNQVYLIDENMYISIPKVLPNSFFKEKTKAYFYSYCTTDSVSTWEKYNLNIYPDKSFSLVQNKPTYPLKSAVGHLDSTKDKIQFLKDLRTILNTNLKTAHAIDKIFMFILGEQNG